MENEMPIMKDYFPLGEGRGIQLTLWSNNAELTRTEKNSETGKWETKQEINLAPTVLKELMWRIPLMLEKINLKNKNNNSKNERQNSKNIA